MELKTGTKVEFNVGTSGTVWTGVVKSMHDNHEYVEVEASGLLMSLPKSVLRVIADDQPEPSEYDEIDYVGMMVNGKFVTAKAITDNQHPFLYEIEPEYDADKAERQHEATLDAVEAERDLKAYRAEHGDDAPDPTPIIPKAELTIEHARFLKKIDGAGDDIELSSEENDLFLQLNLLHMVFWHDDDECYVVMPEGGRWLKEFTAKAILDGVQSAAPNDNEALYVPPTPAELQERFSSCVFERAELKIENAELNMQLATARAAQDQLRDELTAITAERDKYKTRYEELHDERKKIWDMVMEANSEWQLTNDLYELMK